MSELLLKHAQLIEDCNIASLRVELIVGKDTVVPEIEERRIGNLCVSVREDAILETLENMYRIYNKYGKYSNMCKKECVISYTLYSRIKDKGIYCKRIMKKN